MTKPRAPKLSNEAVRKSIAADDAQRRERTNAKRRERAAAVKTANQAAKDAAEAEANARIAAKDMNAEYAAVLDSQWVDFCAVNEMQDPVHHTKVHPLIQMAFATYLNEQGFNADGSIMTLDDEPAPKAHLSKSQYTGPMLALRAAAKSYVKGANGNPHCNDPVAALLAGVSREATVLALGSLLFVKGVTTSVNPYKDLNPGQQSMNLRNKLRGAMKNGFVKLDDVAQALITHAPKA